MALNNFTPEQAIERCIAIRDKLPLDEDLPLKEKWADKDAMAVLINYCTEAIKANGGK